MAYYQERRLPKIMGKLSLDRLTITIYENEEVDVKETATTICLEVHKEAVLQLLEVYADRLLNLYEEVKDHNAGGKRMWDFNNPCERVVIILNGNMALFFFVSPGPNGLRIVPKIMRYEERNSGLILPKPNEGQPPEVFPWTMFLDLFDERTSVRHFLLEAVQEPHHDLPSFTDSSSESEPPKSKRRARQDCRTRDASRTSTRESSRVSRQRDASRASRDSSRVSRGREASRASQRRGREASRASQRDASWASRHGREESRASRGRHDSVVSFGSPSRRLRSKSPHGRPKSALRKTTRQEEEEEEEELGHQPEAYKISQEEEEKQKEEEQKEEEKNGEATAEKKDFLRDMSDLFDAVSLNGNAKKETKKLVSLLKDTLSGTVTDTTPPLGAVAAGADNPPPNMGVGLAGAVATAPPPPPGVDRYGGGGFGFASSSSSSGYGSASTFMGSTVYSSFIPPSPPWMASMDEERTEPLASRIARLEAQGGLVLQPATVKKETNTE